MNNKKITEILGISFLATLMVAVTQQQTITYATSDDNPMEGEGCSRIDASDPDLEGWQIETCGDGSQTWIKPDGTRCVANEASGVSSCEDMVSKGIGNLN
jgi:hypothetical protein